MSNGFCRNGVIDGWRVPIWLAVCAASVLSAAWPTTARADTLVLPMNKEFSGAFSPEGSFPWLTATVDDGGTPGSVELTLDTTNLIGSEFVFDWYMNFDANLDLTKLMFSSPSKSGAFADPTINTSENAYRADGDGYFDILFDFANGGGPNNRFNVGDAVSYTVTSTEAITAQSFNFLSFNEQETGLTTASHVGGIGEDGGNSGWITADRVIPEPAAIGLLAVGGLLVGRRRRM